MTYEEFNAYCGSLPATTYVVQWGGSHVWKVGGKVFAIGRWNGAHAGITFKVTPMSFDVLREQDGMRPAPYLASRGMKWIHHDDAPGLSDEDLSAYIRESHRLVALGLSRKRRQELGLDLPQRCQAR